MVVPRLRAAVQTIPLCHATEQYRYTELAPGKRQTHKKSVTEKQFWVLRSMWIVFVNLKQISAPTVRRKLSCKCC